ncbi:MAG: PEP-CTERM sorting domain-containing protein [Verrucomicrobiota bacterium]
MNPDLNILNGTSSASKAVTRFVVIAIISLLAFASANAQQLTTLFASNNNGSPGGAVYFDATIGSNALSITSFDVNTASTMSFSNFQVWILAGMTSQGHETSPGWVQVASGSGTGAGTNNPTAVTLSNSFTLNAVTLYGIALIMDPSAQHFYTNGTGANQNFSNSDLALSLGSASNIPFTAPIFAPRVWNGTIHYSAVPEPSAVALLSLGAAGLVFYRRARRARKLL